MLLKGPASKNLRYRQARTPLRGDPIASPNFCWWYLPLKEKKQRLVHRVHILMMVLVGRLSLVLVVVRCFLRRERHFLTGILV